MAEKPSSTSNVIEKDQERRTPSAAEQRWEEKVLKPTLEKSPERAAEFTTVSGYPIRRLYTEADLADWDADRDLGFPGEPPYTRGIHPTMYRGRLWTMRQFAGFGTAEDTNQRFRYLLSQGQTGLSVAFDLADADGLRLRPRAFGRRSRQMRRGDQFAGGHGSAVRPDSAGGRHDFDDDQFARGGDLGDVPGGGGKAGRGLEENFGHAAKRHSEGIHRAEGIHLSAGTFDAAGDRHVRIRREAHAEIQSDFDQRLSHSRGGLDGDSGAGVHAARRNRICRVGHAARAGRGRVCAAAFVFLQRAQRFLRGDREVPRRAAHLVQDDDASASARRIARSWALRFHTQTAGCSLTAQQPYNNVVRTAIQALAAVMGGTQSLHTNSLDEAWALPTEFAATLALRTQQIIAHESGVTNTVDPLGGSYFVEALTNEVEHGAWEYIEQDRCAGRHGGGDRARLPAARNCGGGVSLSGGRRPQGEDYCRRE